MAHVCACCASPEVCSRPNHSKLGSDCRCGKYGFWLHRLLPCVLAGSGWHVPTAVASLLAVPPALPAGAAQHSACCHVRGYPYPHPPHAPIHSCALLSARIYSTTLPHCLLGPWACIRAAVSPSLLTCCQFILLPPPPLGSLFICFFLPACGFPGPCAPRARSLFPPPFFASVPILRVDQSKRRRNERARGAGTRP